MSFSHGRKELFEMEMSFFFKNLKVGLPLTPDFVSDEVQAHLSLSSMMSQTLRKFVEIQSLSPGLSPSGDDVHLYVVSSGDPFYFIHQKIFFVSFDYVARCHAIRENANFPEFDSNC